MEFHSKDIQIIRQSQIKLAMEFLSNHGIICGVEELQRVTDVFVECCLRPTDIDLKNRIRELDKWIIKKKNEQQS
jgi:hypothetical protein